MKIPESPRPYQPGDVVNGHVLDERGNWVPLEAPAPPGPGMGTAPGPGMGPAPDPTANPYLSAAPQATPSPGMMKSADPKRSALMGCGIFAGIFAIFVIIFIVVATQMVRSVTSGFAEESEPAVTFPGEDWELDDEDPLDAIPEIPSFTLTEDEKALFEVTEWEVWHAEFSSHFVLTIAAPGLERPRAGTSVQITALDADGVRHEGHDFVTLRSGEPTLSVGFFTERFDAEVVDLTAEFVPLGVVNDPDPYEVEVSQFSVDDAGFRPTVRVTLTAGPYGEAPGNLRLTAVVRDDDGGVINVGIASLAAPGVGEATEVDLMLWDGAPVSESDTWEFGFILS